MNKKGFSLIELLAVIIILSVIMTLGFVGFGSIQNATKEKMVQTKIEEIETGAQKYGQEHMNDLTSSCKVDGADYKFCKTITVQTILDSGDFESEERDGNRKIVINNVTNEEMNTEKICVYKKNNRVYAVMYSKFKPGDRC